MAILGLHHVGISTANLERSVAFYCTLFGFEKVFDFEWKPGMEMFDRMMALRGTAARVAMLRTGICFLEIFEFALRSMMQWRSASAWRRWGCVCTAHRSNPSCP
jgi:catechol 2,3-dioxygenase-like lactoylglutathione lyase family enzyme